MFRCAAFPHVASQVPSSERHSYHLQLKYQDTHFQTPEAPVVSRILECKSLLLFTLGKMLSLSAFPSVTVLSRNMWGTHKTLCFLVFFFFLVWPHYVTFGIPVLQGRMEPGLPHWKRWGLTTEPPRNSLLQVFPAGIPPANILRHIKKKIRIGGWN